MMLTVKLKLTVVFDAQHGGFTTGWSPVSWGSIDELFVNLTMSPHVLKPWIYNDQAWRWQTSVGAGQSNDTTAGRLFPVNGQVFFEEFTRRMTVARDRPVYKFLHLGIPHRPIALNEHCAVVDLRAYTRENYTEQARGVVAGLIVQAEPSGAASPHRPMR